MGGKGGGGGGGKSGNGGVRVKAEDLDSLDDSDEEEERGERRRKKKEGGEEDGMDVEGGVSEFEKALPKLRGKTLDAVATLSKTRRYREHLERVQEGINMVDPPPMSVPLESDPEYQLIVSSNRLVQGTRGGGEGGKEGVIDDMLQPDHSPLPPSPPPSRH